MRSLWEGPWRVAKRGWALAKLMRKERQGEPRPIGEKGVGVPW